MELVKLFEEMIHNTVNINKFMDIEFGEVLEEKPLKIKINEIITLEEDNLILTNAVRDHSIDVTVNWETEDKKVDLIDNHTHLWAGGAFGATGPVNKSSDINSTHKHDIKGKKKMIVHNNLKKNEKVLLIKAIGGQKYVVVDRLTDFKNEGQWIE